MDGQGVALICGAGDRPALKNAPQLVVACYGVYIPAFCLLPLSFVCGQLNTTARPCWFRDLASALLCQLVDEADYNSHAAL